MLFAVLMAASIVDWVPMRWISPDPKSLELVKGTPVNCLLLEGEQATPQLTAAASEAGLSTLIVLRPAPDAIAQLEQALKLSPTGIVLEGDFEAEALTALRAAAKDKTLIELPSRARMRFDKETPVVGTNQGVWPGVQIDTGGTTKAAPSGAPWINTNSGFLRFVRSATISPVWIANTPPIHNVNTAERYLQVIGDAAMVGARWVVALDAHFSKQLLSREPDAVKAWRSIGQHLAHFEQNKAWRTMEPLGQLAIVQDVDSGALFSGGVLDMIAVKHTPVRAVPSRMLEPKAMVGSRMAVNVDPSSLTEAQREALKAFARGGGTLLTAPASWKFPQPDPDSITLSEKDVKVLDEIWKEVNTMTGRQNLGVRLFNVSSMLSNAVRSQDGNTAVVHLVNYSDYPVENVTVHLLRKFKSAKLLAPGAEPVTLELYEHEDGSGVDIANIGFTATIILE
ncbi:MAG TPA: hypothetical protein VEQ63_12830 [Bryobacteraceae bacterium]|nr:hypothetical protein [Bryobacteraceae bacterium]